MTAKTTRQTDEVIYTDVAIVLLGSIAVTMATRAPMKSSVTPSIIHPMATMFRLSALIGPNPRTIDFVGKRWAIPQKNGIAAPTYIRNSAFIFQPPSGSPSVLAHCRRQGSGWHKRCG